MQKTMQLIPVYNDWEYLKLHIPEPDPLVKINSLHYELLNPYDPPSINDPLPFLHNLLLDIWQKRNE